MPAWLEIACGVIILDFSIGYLSHRTMHAWPALWRFHQVHHSDPFVDVTTTFRAHPVETVWRFAFSIHRMTTRFDASRSCILAMCGYCFGRS
jgi:sterol desaturase/sphingolipid hydroxylase (fatty acid hydroxylase superfamily)